jgi:trans-2,3-dihydro-3-hydroxyanthranilate isomerase
MQELGYETVDVFTDTRFGGNQLAVIAHAYDLSKEAMQQIASEFNYSEVTFVGPPSDPSNTALRDGPVITGASTRAPRDLEIGKNVDAEVIASCVSLRRQEIITAHHKPVIASVGLPFAIAEVQSLEALGRTKPNSAAFSDGCVRYQCPEDRFSVFVYTRCAPAATRLRARMFAPLSNILEDPATGSASAALGGLLCSLDPRSDAEMHLVIEQGVEMGRPSTIAITARKQAGSVREVTVAGRCVEQLNFNRAAGLPLWQQLNLGSCAVPFVRPDSNSAWRKNSVAGHPSFIDRGAPLRCTLSASNAADFAPRI